MTEPMKHIYDDPNTLRKGDRVRTPHGEGEIVDLTYWMDNSISAEVYDDEGIVHKYMLDYPKGDLC